ncbi:MAG: hypothetical protein JXA49_08800 [Actinobacteria bacterium]|nr:hypothetical protein [Actinomycetota bacterium]
MENRKADYIYDFGDYWKHAIELEDILPAGKGKQYPVCVGGKRSCPPFSVVEAGRVADLLLLS